MAAALASLQQHMTEREQRKMQKVEDSSTENEKKETRNLKPISALMISPTASLVPDLFATHPRLETRIERLRLQELQDQRIARINASPDMREQLPAPASGQSN